MNVAEGPELELDRRDDAEVAAGAAKGPEQVGLCALVRPHNLARGSNELDGGNAVRL
jgi:hypothetical protein